MNTGSRKHLIQMIQTFEFSMNEVSSRAVLRDGGKFVYALRGEGKLFLVLHDEGRLHAALQIQKLADFHVSEK